ncbi:hypothetical protein BUALT_Bualt12G0083800 [Buddleja alternifolia]|uniref:BZIP domain-containing protein n=1 Tax=Buddleja alternifolia TaxID=168488 RepID=A0AAV6WQY1_9LAMI|nr:hypothetical protein BUALT_Bualt12G0083800 [Buddleja alternifolia]
MEGSNNIEHFPLKLNSTENSRTRPFSPKQSVIDSCPKFIHNNNIQMEIPLPPSQHKYTSSLTLDAPANPRAILTLDKAIENELNHGRKLGPNMDIKKLRRTISNRLSAKRSRIRKSQYIKDMEKTVNHLQELISSLTPQIESHKEKQKLLILENDSLQKLVEIRSNESKLHELELEKKKNEVYKLKEVEKIVNKDKHDSSSRSQQMQDLSLEKFMAQPYLSLQFYRFSLQHLETQHESNQFFPGQLSGSSFVQSELKMTESFGFVQCNNDQVPDCKGKQSVEEMTLAKNQEEANIDRYLNFEALNFHPASS